MLFRSIPGKPGSFKESLEGKLSSKISDIKGKFSGDKTGEGKKPPGLVKSPTNPLKQPLIPGKIAPGLNPGGISGKTGSPAAEAKSKIEKSFSSLGAKNIESKQPEKPKESPKTSPEKVKTPAETTSPKETKQEKPEKKPSKETESNKPSPEGGPSGISGMEDIKGLLSQIAISLSSPVTFYNPDPFRPDSRRI